MLMISSNQCFIAVYIFILLSFPTLYLFSHFPGLIACQAEKELQPWIAKDDDLGQKMWRINQRIVKLIVELMRNHDSSESLVILASASDLLLRATDGMLVDGEACTLPQLEVECYNSRFSLTFQVLFIYQVRLVLPHIQPENCHTSFFLISKLPHLSLTHLHISVSNFLL